MWTLSLKEILEASGGKLLFGTLNGVTGISIDSRSIKENELFVALKGARFDGHDFLVQALNQGIGAIVSVPPASPPRGKVIIHVSNTLKALQDIARYLREKSEIPVTGITGTNGKSTTKEMAASVLGIRHRVHKNTGNLNNNIGLPLSLLGLELDDEMAVLEMGASARGDIRELCRIALPDYGVLTNIGLAHIEGFKDIASVRDTKLEILEFVNTIVVNADDKFLMEGLEGYEGRIITCGTSDKNDVYATDISQGKRSTGFTLHAGGRSAEVRLHVAGRFNVLNALTAAGVGTIFDMDITDIKAGLESFEGMPMRLEIKEFRGATVISDVYNANPASMEEALLELLRLKEGRAIAVLGDMLELGPYAETAHRKLGEWLASAPVDIFIAVGPLMGIAAREFAAVNRTAIAVADAQAAREALKGECREGDTILIKGSRGTGMESVINNNGNNGEAGK